MKQPVHKCDSVCGTEKNPAAAGGSCLSGVMPQKGSNTVPVGEKHGRKPGPMTSGGGPTEQPQ